MNDSTKLLIAVGIGASMFIIPRWVKAQTKTTEGTTITLDPSGNPVIIDQQTGQVLAEERAVALQDIPWANWTVPLYLTVERDIQLGFLDLLTPILSAGSTVIGTVGSAVGTALSGITGVVTGTVVPAITSIGGSVANVITAIPGTISTAGSYLGTAGSAVWDLASSAGSNIWDAAVGAAKYVTANPETVKNAISTVGTLATTVMAIKEADKTTVSTTPEQALADQQAGVQTKTYQMGLISSSPFSTQWGPSLMVYKLYNPQLKDTLLVTNTEAVQKASEVGYQVQQNIGYCSPGPFLGSVPMILMFNEKLTDHLVITNPQAVPQFEKAGYVSRGYIGYCKQLQTE